VDGRNSLVTLAAYLTATVLISAAAFYGVFRYSLSQRLDDLRLEESTVPPALATMPVSRGDANAVLRSVTSSAEQQRIRMLEALLNEKTEKLRQKAADFEAKSASYRELQARYDEAVLLAIDTLTQDVEAEREKQNQANRGAAAVPVDPQVLEAELKAADVVHESLVSDLTALQTELERAYVDMDQLKDSAAQEISARLREALVLEAAAAEMLLRGGTDSVPALREALNHANPIVRRFAATVLGGIGPAAAEAIPALNEALTDPEVIVRDAARAALDAIEK
jgi:hypothetical protein